MLHQNRKAAIGLIFVTLTIEVAGWGLIIPVLPTLLKEMMQCDTSMAAKYNGYLATAYATMQFLFAPIMGNLSDQYGRRPVLLASLIGFTIDYIFLAFAPSIVWFFVGRIVAGLTGASFSAGAAYIADLSTQENRTKNFGLIGAAFGIGFVLGPALGGFLGQFGSRVPFIGSAVLTFINFLFVLFFMPESLPVQLRRKFQWSRANPLGSLMLFIRYPKITGLIVSLALIHIAGFSVQATWSYFNIERFNWSDGLIGISLAIVGILVGLVQGLLTRFVNPRLGNEKSIYTGLLFYVAGLILFAFATQSWMMFAFLIPYCLGGIAMPAIQSFISSNVPSNEQGELQGALTSLMSLAMIFGPLLMSETFAYFTKSRASFYFPGAAFCLGALLMFLSALVARKHLKKLRMNTAG